MADGRQKQWSWSSTLMTIVLLSAAWYVYQIVSELNPPPRQPPPARFVADKPEPVSSPQPVAVDEPEKSLPPPVIHAGPSHIRWATAKEDSILWNIDRDRFLEDKREDLTEFQEITGEAVLPSTYEFARSVPNPPYIVETQEVIQTGLAAVREYLHEHKIDPVTDLCEFLFEEDRFFSYLGKTDERENSTDRTLSVLVELPGLFNPDFVRMIQRRCLAKWKLWRVYLIAYHRDGEEHLLIYPDRIFIGAEEYLPEQMDEPIRKWQTSIERLREPKEGPQRRQFKYLRAQIPLAVIKLKTEPVVVLATFDSCCGEFDQHSMWFLYPSKQFINVTSPKDYSHGHRFISVNSKGEIVKDDDSENTFQLEEIGLNASDIAKVELTVGRMAKPWKSNATTETTIKDADLLKTESAADRPKSR